MRNTSLKVIPAGFEPATYCLEGSCSIQLSYETLDYAQRIHSGSEALHRESPQRTVSAEARVGERSGEGGIRTPGTV